MNQAISLKSFRKDIEGIRTIAILAVIIYHFGFLPSGYFGVDILFVLTGYFTAKSIMKDISTNNFSLKQYYFNKIKRLTPSVLLVSIVVMIFGYFVMLPDDYDSLAQSVVATNLFSNNILAYITTGNYWDVANDYKPLMHTWALGIEEKFYFIYPLLFWIFGKKKHNNTLKIVLFFLTAISMILFILPIFDTATKFYLLPFRFFEMSIGGIVALIFNNNVLKHSFTPLLLIGLLSFLIFDLSFISNTLKHLIVVMIVVILIISNNINNRLLSNKITEGIGKLSFSLFLWHQPILAFYRYVITDNLTIIDVIILSILILVISYLSYILVEHPIKNKKFSKPKLLSVVGMAYIIVLSTSLIVYVKAGVVRDVPELDIIQSETKRGLHGEYNDLVYQLDKGFSDEENIKVFVIGDSFARDWVNILQESEYGNVLDIKYTYSLTKDHIDVDRIREADIIFFSRLSRSQYKDLDNQYDIDDSKVFNVGTKNFGTNNGKFYANRGSENYFNQKTYMEDGYLEINKELQNEWGDRYINLIALIIDENNQVPVFTPSNKFISQDTWHLTKAGAEYLAKIIDFERYSSLSILLP